MSGLPAWFAALDMRWVLVGLLLFLDVWCIQLCVRSDASNRDKALWTGVILLCPLIGCMFWYVLGPRPWLIGREKPGAD